MKITIPKTTNPIHFLIATLALMGTSQAAVLVVNTTQPSAAETIISQPAGNTYTRIFTDGVRGDGNESRGMLFEAPTSGSVDSITLVKNSSQTFSNDTVKLWVFQGTMSDWVTGNGDADGDIFNDTTCTVLVDGLSFTLNGAINGGDYMHFNLDNPVAMAAGSSYGFVFQYFQGSGSNDFLQIGQTSASPGLGEQIQVSSTVNLDPAGETPLQYYVSVVPEPTSSTLLGLGIMGLVLRRRRS